MGMFDRDKNFGEHFSPGDRFILTSLVYEGEIATVNGTAQKCRAGIVREGASTKDPEKYSLLGKGFAEQARRANRGDFPCVVEYVKIPLPGDKEVKRFEFVPMDPADFFGGDHGPEINVGEAAATTPGAAADDDVGF